MLKPVTVLKPATVLKPVTVLAAAAAMAAGVMSGCGSAGHPAAGAPPVTAGAPLGAPATTTGPAAGTGAVGTGTAGHPGTGGTAPGTTTTPSCTATRVVAAWPLARRVAQVIGAPTDRADPAAVAEAVHDQVGGILLLGSLPPAGPLRAALAPARTGGAAVPLVMADEEGGGVQRLVPAVTSMPWPRDMARTMTTAQVRALAAQVGGQMKALGVGVDLAPVADLDAGSALTSADPDGPRSFGPDPAVAARYAAAFAAGMADSGVLAVVKHFPGLGGATGNTDYGPAATPAWAGPGAAALQPFRSVLAGGAGAVMVANATVPGLSAGPASLSPAVITTVLRRQLGFRGLVVTDSLSAGAIGAAGYSLPAAAVAAIGAGADMVLFGSTLTPGDEAALAPAPLQASISAVEAALTAAVVSGRLPAARLDAAVADVMAAKGVNLCQSH